MLCSTARRNAMLRAAGELKGLSIAATDGDIGSVKDLYFDDLTWTVRYLVVDTGAWLPGRQVLVSPLSVRGTATDEVVVDLTRAQVEGSPPIEADKPVDRQQEEALSRYYRHRYYWEGPYRWGLLAYPGMPPVPEPVAGDPVVAEMAARERVESDPSLRSARDVTGYYIAAQDGDIGHVNDFLVDDRAWAIRYLVVDTRNWWPGRKVVLSPEWIKTVSWADSRVYVDLRRDQIKAAPEYDASVPFERAHENRLFEHHRRRKYWEWEER
jgi:sporulation protein YlmC with PRC-barrel domain